MTEPTQFGGPRADARRSRRRRPGRRLLPGGQLVPTALLLLLTAITTAATLLPLESAFAGDTRYYAAMALHLTGHSQDESQAIVAAMTAQLGFETPPTETLFGWGLVLSRPVYPLLSVPFVAIWGISGMIVVPVVAFALGVLVIARVASRLAPAPAALAVVVLLLASSRQVFYGTIMLTESLAMLLVALIVSLYPLEGRKAPWGALVGIAVLMTVLAFTRQSTLIPAGAAFVAWLGTAAHQRSLRNHWLPVASVTAVLAVGWQVAQSLMFPDFSQVEQWYLKTGAEDLGGALAETPGLAWHILRTDVTVMAAQDRALLLLLALAVVAALTRFRHVDGQMLIGALLAVVLYNVTNGTPTQFRYGAPALVLVVTAVAVLLNVATQVGQRYTQRRPTS